VVEPTGQEVCRVERSTPFALLGKIVAAWSHARRLEHLHNSTRSRRSPTQLERRRAKKYSTGWYCTGTLIACSTGYCRDTPRKPVKSKNQVTVVFLADRSLAASQNTIGPAWPGSLAPPPQGWRSRSGSPAPQHQLRITCAVGEQHGISSSPPSVASLLKGDAERSIDSRKRVAVFETVIGSCRCAG